MKFQPDRLEGTNAITRCENAQIWVNGQAHSQSLVVPARGDCSGWDVSRLEELRADHFERLLHLSPEVVVFGSGKSLRFVAPALYRALIERQIGVETMDTAAACRTYNILASEGRRVVAVLLQEAPPDVRDDAVRSAQ